MAEEDYSFLDLFEETKEPIKPETVGALDYVTDIPLGAIKGVSQAVQGLLQLGALPIDYLADTNLITAIDNIFDKITPETDTVVGDVTSVFCLLYNSDAADDLLCVDIGWCLHIKKKTKIQ